MYYQESLDSTMYKAFPEIIEKFDSLLGELSVNYLDKLTTSFVYSKIGGSFELAKKILEAYVEYGVLEKKYEIHCPECGLPLKRIDEREVYEQIGLEKMCYSCNEKFIVDFSDVYIAYNRLKPPTAPPEEINKVLIEKLKSKSENSFFNIADSLGNSEIDINRIFNNLNESAYNELVEYYKAIDYTYKNTKLKGEAYEKLACKLLNSIKGVTSTNILKTDTNQIDVYSVVLLRTVYESMINYLAPVFYSECKNEPDNAPDITYYEKLASIILKSKIGKIGILFSRKRATRPALRFSKQLFMINGIAIINLCDEDLNKIIYEHKNLLEYLMLKYSEIISCSDEGVDLIKDFLMR